MSSQRTEIPDFDRPVLKASHDERLGLVCVLATFLATVPDGDALNPTCALDLLDQLLALGIVQLPEPPTMRVEPTATELSAFLCDSVPMHASFT